MKRLQVSGILALVLLSGCGDGPTATAGSGALRVRVVTSGGDPDDSYVLVIDGDRRESIPANITYWVSAVAPGERSLTLDGIAENCAATSSLPRSVAVTGGVATDVDFTVTCDATGIHITTQSAGVDGFVFFRVLLNGVNVGEISANGQMILTRLPPGVATIELQTDQVVCESAGGLSTIVTVTNREVTSAAFVLECGVPPLEARVAYTLDSLGTRTAWVRTDGSSPATLDFGRRPRWSPTGLRLIYSDAACDEWAFYYGCSGGVIVLDPATRRKTRLENARSGADPAWSPTRNEVVFVALGFSPAGDRLRVAGINGSTSVQLSTPSLWALSDPDWSPDGDRIVFTCGIDTSNLDVCVIARNGTGFVRLTTTTAVERTPAWSPDGTRIAFSSQQGDGATEIVVLVVSSGEIENLGPGRTPAWLPDGSRLVFAREDGLFVMNSDGSGVARLTTGAHHSPAWRPGGTQ